MDSSDESPTEIEVFTLTTYAVAPDGSGVRMNAIDVHGRPASVLMPIDCVRALALTMPKMVSDAVSGGRGDPSIRVVHSVDSWLLEREKDEGALLLTIETSDQLQMSFKISETALAELVDSAPSDEMRTVPEFGCH